MRGSWHLDNVKHGDASMSFRAGKSPSLWQAVLVKLVIANINGVLEIGASVVVIL